MNIESINFWHDQLLSGACCAVNPQSGETIARPSAAAKSRLIFPGAFNPLHDGHRAMADAAQDMLQASVEFEISMENVDKPPITSAELHQRLQQFPPAQAIWLTRAMHFRDKAELFPGATFIVGADTITRIGDAGYYDNDARQRNEAMDDFALHGCRFLVFGRSAGEEFRVLPALTLPPALAALCIEVPEETFRFDLTSTQLRIASRSQGGR